MLNKRPFWGLLTLITLILLLTLNFSFFKQNGLQTLWQNQRVRENALEEKLQIEQNILLLIGDLSQLNIPTRIASIFKNRYLILEDFAHLFHGKIQGIIFTDMKGKVLLSNNSNEVGRIISQDIRSWINSHDQDTALFLSDKETAMFITWYDDPHSLSKRGYLLINVPSDLLFEHSNIKDYYISFVRPYPPSLIISNKKHAIDVRNASQILSDTLYKNALDEYQGTVVDILYLGHVVYIMGTKHVPIFFIVFSLLLLSLFIVSLIRFIQNQSSVTPISEANDANVWNNINQLIQDISNDTVYDYREAKNMMDTAIESGYIAEEKFSKNPDNVLITPHNSNSTEVLSNQQDDKNIGDQLNTLPSSPISMPDESNNSDVIHPNISPSDKNVTIEEKILNQFSALFMQYDITKYTIGKKENDAFIFTPLHSNLELQFSIETSDPIYSNVLAHNQVLSLSGKLEQSNYLKNIISTEILNQYGELFIIPISQDKNIIRLLLLLRERDLPLLSYNEKEEIFTQESTI